MDVKSEESSMRTIGQKIRQARQDRGMTQEALAGDEFTKGYVSALERGAVRPSLKALEVFARRLQLPMREFLSAPQDLQTEPDLDALQEDLHYQLNYANMLIHNNDIEQALQLLNAAEETIQPYREQLSIYSQYRVPYLRGMAFIQSRETKRGRMELEASLRLVETVDADDEAVARVRNLIGVTYSLEGQLRLAEEQHLQCLHAITGGKVKDPNLRLSIYRNLANDYWALNEFTQAIGIYKEALHLLEDYHDLDRQAQIYWGLAAAYKAAGDWAQAKLYATRALYIYEAENNRASAATVSMNLAELLVKDSQFAEAEQLLGQAKVFLEGAGDQMLLSNWYQAYADLARKQGELERAAEYVAKGIDIAADLYSQAVMGNIEAAGYVLRNYALVLHTAALVEEAQGRKEVADQLFHQALQVIQQTDYQEVLDRIAFGYAEVLRARGDYQQAMEYFRTAAESRMHQNLKLP